jgi:GNAT superfamily N-acetyltransferase
VADDFQLEAHTGTALVGLLDEVTELYLNAYHDRPQGPGTIWNRDVFRNRTIGQSASPGFTLITACDSADRLVGFAFGFSFRAERWWRDSPPPPPELSGKTKFAVIELVVREAERGRGLSRLLLDQLTRERTEDYATLWSNPTSDARKIYDHWGWTQAASTEPANDGRVFHILIHPLPLFNEP